MPPARESRLARSLGPLGLIGSVLLHGAVLAALLEHPRSRRADATPEPPASFAVAFVPTPTAAPIALPMPDAPLPDTPLEAVSPPRPTPPEETAAAALATVAPAPPATAEAPPVPRPKRPRPVAKSPDIVPTATAPSGQAAEAPPSPSLTTVASAPSMPVPASDPTPEPVRIAHVRARDRIPPVYPELARRDELEGTVRLKLVVSPSGRVEEAAILQSSGHRLLDQAAQSAVRLWQLYPAERDGKPVPGWAEVEIPFRLTD